ncbi:P-type Ca(2+) transporter [Trifolium repens]|nr:P-type Ca(2+) transporter [Trifolium repens]
MESFLNPKDFELENKDRSIENLSRWRSAVSLVKNPRRRFRHVADLVKRRQAAENQKKIQNLLELEVESYKQREGEKSV